MATIPAGIFSFPGTVNDANYTDLILGYTFLPETLLFLNPVVSRTIRTNGDSGWNVQTSFAIKENGGHNNFWRLDGGTEGEGGWEPFYVATNDTPDVFYRNYPLADFSALLF